MLKTKAELIKGWMDDIKNSKAARAYVSTIDSGIAAVKDATTRDTDTGERVTSGINSSDSNLSNTGATSSGNNPAVAAGISSAFKKAKLIKALADAGHRESALLLKNWGEMDANAKSLAKAHDFGEEDDSVVIPVDDALKGKKPKEAKDKKRTEGDVADSIVLDQDVKGRLPDGHWAKTKSIKHPPHERPKPGTPNPANVIKKDS